MNSATGVTPYRAVFGVDSFDFGVEANLSIYRDKEPDDLASLLFSVHDGDLQQGVKSRIRAKSNYDEAMDGLDLHQTNKVVVYEPNLTHEEGRKFSPP